MKIGVIAELLRKPLNEDLDFAGQELKVDGVQLYAQHPEGGIDLTSCTDEELKDLQEKCRKNNIVISAICGDVGGNSFQVESEALERVEMTKKIIDNTAKLGVKVVTTHVGHIPESKQDPVYPIMLKHVRTLAEYAASKGCTMAIETGPEPIERILALIKASGDKGLGINFDPANLAMVLNVNPAKEALAAGKYIVHTHAKDGNHLRDFNPSDIYGSLDTYDLTPPEQQTKDTSPVFEEVPLGKGQVPWDEYLEALRSVGYDGFLTIEREVGADPKADILMAVDFLKSKIS